MKLKKIYNFGKIDYYNIGQKNNSVEVEINYNIAEGKQVFTACGTIWNSRHSDAICGGQCLDTIAEYITAPVFLEIYKLWKKYHLNAMHPECEHQNALGWWEKAKKEVILYEYSLNIETSRKQSDIENKVIKAAKNGELYKTTPAEQKILRLSHFYKLPCELPEDLKPFYKKYKEKRKTLGWLTPDEHPDGILTKPCPICGYKYGTAWKYFPIPEYDKKIILSLFD